MLNTTRAREYRKRMTDAEVRLWVRLRRLREHGYHFRRQSPEGRFVLDFVCRRQGLVVELDGWRHAEDGRAKRDQIRDEILQRRGFTVLRFWNNEIDQNIEGVLHTIVVQLEATSPTRSPALPTTTLPSCEEGREILSRYR